MQERHAVVELVVADDHRVVAHRVHGGRHRVRRTGLGERLHLRVVLNQRRPLDGVTVVEQERVLVEAEAWQVHASVLEGDRQGCESYAWNDHAAWLDDERRSVEGIAWQEHDDVLRVETLCEAARGARLSLAQSVWRGEQRLFSARVELACINAAGGPARLPQRLRDALRP